MDGPSNEPPLPAPQPETTPEEDAAPDRCPAAPAVPSPLGAVPPPLPHRRPGRPWGFWATAGWTALLTAVWYVLALVFTLVSYVALAFLAGILPRSGGAFFLYRENEGSMHLLLVLFLAPPLLGLIALLSGVRRMGVREYLALTRPQPKETFAWLMGMLALIGVAHAILHVADYHPAVDYGLLLYTTSPLPLLLFAVCVVGPALEEIWYRGFVFRGIAASKAGPLAAVVLTAALFALMHVHYEWPEKLVAFVLGLYLATVRWRSGSTVLAIFCHAGSNLYFVAATATQVHWLGRTVPPL